MRTDHGSENILVWHVMLEEHSTDDCVIAGSSTHNEHIGRLWRDVYHSVLCPQISIIYPRIHSMYPWISIICPQTYIIYPWIYNIYLWIYDYNSFASSLPLGT